jgi:hypothetical protein
MTFNGRPGHAEVLGSGTDWLFPSSGLSEAPFSPSV